MLYLWYCRPLGASPPEAQKVASNDSRVASRTGAFEYQYPITVPAGRVGMQPALSLGYSSQGQLYGDVAANWSLAIPEIRVDYSEGRLVQLMTPSEQLPWKSDLAGGHRLVPLKGESSYRQQSYRAEVDGGYVSYDKYESAQGPK